MKKVGSPLCSMCGMEVETPSHNIIHCKYSKKLWKDIKGKIVYLGWLSKGPKSQLVNFIILLYKYQLYTVREDVSKVCLSAFKWYVNHTQTIENVIAKKNGRIEKHLSGIHYSNCCCSSNQWVEMASCLLLRARVVLAVVCLLFASTGL